MERAEWSLHPRVLYDSVGIQLREWADNEPWLNWVYVGISMGLVVFAGLMSGLTLGLMSLDLTQMEVLRRSGTQQEKDYATKIAPIIKNSHFLLVTLLLCNAAAMEALPLFLDRLANPVMAIIVSVTAVLFFGEIIPQSVCTKYGLAIGANLSWLVQLLMWLCSPIAWPMGKLLDSLLGAEHHVLFRRKQLKVLVDIHGEDKGMGGKLSTDEIKVITGALDLTSKIAYKSMTPLDKVFMLSTDDKLDEATLRSILASGHSRIPVHRAGNRSDLVGLLLVKELLQYKMSQEVLVCMLKMRSLPRLSAATPMYDMLKLFQTGRSHMAVLTQPYPEESHAANGTTSAAAAATAAAATASTAKATPPAAIPSPWGASASSASAPSGSGLGFGAGSMGAPAVEVVEGEQFAAGALPEVVEVRQLSRVMELEGTPSTTSVLDIGDDDMAAVARSHASIPHIAEPGQPIGIITIEDVIEELIRTEIVDETDEYVDNERRIRVNQALLAQALPDRLQGLLTGGGLAAVINATAAAKATNVSRGGSTAQLKTVQSFRALRGAGGDADLAKPLLGNAGGDAA